MSEKLINLSPDLLRLRNEGYDIRIQSGYLVVSHIPYAKADRTVDYGILVTDLDIAGDKADQPEVHTVYFGGAYPCFKDGREMMLLVAEANQQVLDNSLSVAFIFSAKPEGCPQPPARTYPDYYEKIITYVDILLAEAKAIDSSVTATPFNPIVPSPEESVFKYLDTNSSRAGINVLTAKLKSQKIAILGVGGTGSYLLDLVAKTPVGELHIFDGDLFLTHNAFRSPGAASLESLRQRSTKVAYFERIYSNLRNIIVHPEYITPESVEKLAGMDFVFICVDHGPSKKLIVEWLVAHKIPFADAGMEVEKVDEALNGCIRVTIALPDKFDHVSKYLTFGETGEDEYDKNIQIAELNALNAALAVIRWKKWLGFYQDRNRELDGTYCIDSNEIINEETSH